MKEVEERDDTHAQQLNESGETDRYAHLPEQAATGGRAVVDKYGSEHMAKIGRRGSQAVIRKYGLRFYSEIAARNKGVKKRRATG
ncbi:MAG: hypothetical protein ACK47B_11525 [Armatimonadota bacterium]